MTKTIVVIGAGPGIALHVAERFGREGFRVALVSRTEASLDTYCAQLATHGIEASGFQADAADPDGLAETLSRVEDTVGPIEVLEYSPSASREMLATPRNISVGNLRPMLDLTLGAVAAVQAVLPGMLERHSGGLLFTSAASALLPVPFSANFAIGQSGIRSYAHSLNGDLATDGIYSGMILIAGLVDKGDGSLQRPSDPSPTPDANAWPIIAAYDVAELFWDMYTKRDRIEEVAGDLGLLHQLIAAG